MANKNFVYDIILNIKENVGKQIDGISNKFSKLSDEAKFATVALTASFIALGRNLLGVAGNFEKVFKSIEASIKPSVKELEDLRKKAIQIGLTTQFSATQAAEGIELLGKIGIKTSDIIGGVLDNTLALATAMGTELEPAAKLLTDTMTLFNVKVEDAAKTTDLLVGAANNSKFSLEDMALAVAQSGAVAASAGVELREYLVTIAAISPAFASGSDAGTSLKTMLNSLANPTKEAKAKMQELGIEAYNANGSLKSMAEISIELQEGLTGLTEKQKANSVAVIFGADASRAALALASKTREELVALDKAIGDTKTAEIAKKQSEGYLAATKILDNAFEGLKIAIADSGILSFFTKLIGIVSKGIKVLAELPKPVLLVGAAISALAVAGVALVAGLGFLSTTVLPALIAGFGLLSAPILGVVAAVSLAAVLIVNYWDEISDYFTNGTGSKTFNKIIELATVFSDIIINIFNKIVSVITSMWSQFGGELTTIFKNTVDVLLSIVNSVLGVFVSLFSSISNLLSGNFRQAFTDFVLIFANAFGAVTKIVSGAIVLIADEFALFAKRIPVIGSEIAGFFKSVSNNTKDFMDSFDKALEKYSNKKIKAPTFSGGSGFKSNESAEKQAALDKEKADKSQMNKFRQDSKEIALGISQDRIKAKLDELDALKSLDETQLEQLKDRQDKELALTKELYAKQLAESNLNADEQLANNLKINVNELTKEDRIKSLKEITEISKQETTEQGKAAREQLLIINKSYADSASIRLEQEAKVAEQQRKYDKERVERLSSISALKTESEILNIKEDNTNLNALKQQTDNTEKLLELTEQINQNNIKANNLQKLQNDLKLLEVNVSSAQYVQLQGELRQLDRDLAERRNRIAADRNNELASLRPTTRTETVSVPKSTSEINELKTKAEGVKDILLEIKTLQSLLKTATNGVGVELDSRIIEPIKKYSVDLANSLVQKFSDISTSDGLLGVSHIAEANFNKALAIADEAKNKLVAIQQELLNSTTTQQTRIITDTEGFEAAKQAIRVRYARETATEEARILDEKARVTALVEAEAAANNERLQEQIRQKAIKQREIDIEQTKQNLNDRYQALAKGYDADISLLEAYYDELQRLVEGNDEKNDKLAKLNLKRSINNIKDILKGDFVKEEGKSTFQSFADNVAAIFENTYRKKRNAVNELLALLEKERETQQKLNELQSKSAFVNRRANATQLNTEGLTPAQVKEQSDKLFEQTQADYETIKSIVITEEGDIDKIRKAFTKENERRQSAGLPLLKELTDSELAEFIQFYTKRNAINDDFNQKRQEADMSDAQIRFGNIAKFFKEVTKVGQDVATVVGSIFTIINNEAQLQLAMIQETIAKLDEQITFLNESISESESKLSDLKTVFEESTGKRKADALKLYDAENQKLVQLKAAEAGLTAQKKTSEDEAKKVQAGIEARARSLAEINQVVATTSLIAAAAEALKKAFTGTFDPFTGIAAAVASIAAITSLYATAKSVAKFEDGGLVSGARHSQGGVPFTVAGQGGFEMEGGEYIMSRKTVDRIGLNNLDAMNFDRSLPSSPKATFETGGVVPSVSQNQLDINDRLDLMISQNNALLNKDMYVSVTDVNKTNSIEKNRMVSSTF